MTTKYAIESIIPYNIIDNILYAHRMWILALVLFSVVVALLSFLDMRKPKNYPPGNF